MSALTENLIRESCSRSPSSRSRQRRACDEITNAKPPRVSLLINALTLLLLCLVAGCTREEAGTQIDSTTGMELLYVPGGHFEMGTPESEIGHEEQERLHRVVLSPFYLGRTEVTQAQWLEIMGENPSRSQERGADCAVEEVNFHEVEEFLRRLSELSGVHYRLPTEAEWEYACRAGTTTPFSTGPNLTTDQANYAGDFPYADLPEGIDRQHTLPVASFPPNPWGFSDLHGNVWECIEDDHCPYLEGQVVDPVGRPTAGSR